ncbi:MAG TPA: pyruvate kinase [Alphaproteobacteria bacterium]
MRHRRSARIVATLGPASSTPEKIEALFRAGVDVFRLNFSHGTHDDHRARIDAIRALEKRAGRPIAILMDLQGPKLRVGTFEGGRTTLERGAKFRLDLDPKPGSAARAPLPHREIFEALSDGAELLLDDGKIRLRVIEAARDHAVTEVVTGGVLSDRKGVNVPGILLPLSPLTDKDRRDLVFGLDHDVDFVGLSFVQRPEDIAEARKLIQGRAAVCAKLEKPAAIEHLDEIVELSDAIMVARGDLGVEMPPEDVPGLQKRILRASRRLGKPVIVATQMLESMITNPAPTRAEASDVATAVYDGADAVMLSAESASGQYPVEAVEMMDRIIARVEQDPLYRRIMSADHYEPESTAQDAISAAANQVARTIRAAAIVTFTTTGSTTLRAARERPEVPIMCLTPRVATARRLCLCWGTHPILSPEVPSLQAIVDQAIDVARREGFAKKGDKLVLTAGVPLGTPGATNVLRIAWVTD